MLNSKEFVRELQLRHESAWMNPNVGSAETALAALPLTRTDVDDAEARLERFAPFIKKVFPETAADRGLIESPLTEIEHMRAWLNENEGAQLAGKLFLKRDSDLPVAGSVKAQLAEQNIAVDEEHPLLVYIPCGVGGAPGGICFGLKQEFGDAAHVYFAEPVEAPCMLLGLASGLQNAICVQDIGLTGRTAADGLAVSRPSGFVGETVKEMVGGGFTVSDEHLFTDLHALHETERLFVEPSACAGFAGAVELSKMTDYLESSGLGAHWENAAHIVWATGGALVPEGECEKYLAN